ncbi:hypothetical protein OCH239_03145 [Roseivivax halodurans JCM 10272]|uniref:Uncharacterized protein n=1 Tax=Roseivivax halodurans JCM 10272 TaxID=1449350 RepID=X7EER2_9RHOB|nr:hypothetical protein [Roseivivax halodurans]ETX14584.1 hypothetical protein OCH239_03145 [Roseivivax halodurans JCM 10272]
MTLDTMAILTGDIVGSRKIGTDGTAAVFAALGEAFSGVEGWSGGPARLTRSRGDGWQAAVPDGARALRVALCIRAYLRARDLPETRIGIGLGGVKSLGSADLSDGDGPAFYAAADMLERMGRSRRLVLSPQAVPPLAPALVALCDTLAGGWTRLQGEVVWPLLQPSAISQTSLAATLGVTQQSIADRLDAAGFAAMTEALEAFEDALGGSP